MTLEEVVNVVIEELLDNTNITRNNASCSSFCKYHKIVK